MASDDDERLEESLQYTVLAALCYDQEHGAVIAAQVSVEHFDGFWSDFVARVLQYRLRYGRPPREHTSNLAAQASAGREKDSLVRRRLPELLALGDSTNAAYAAIRVQDFIRRQTYKRAIRDAADIHSKGGEDMPDKVERILYDALSARARTLDAGVRLDDPKALRFRERKEFYSLGIPALDKLGIGPTPKQLMLYIGAKNSGKTWFCVHVGTQCIMQRAKVVHVSLEMDRYGIAQRYYQRFFSVANKPGRIPYSKLEIDKALGILKGFKPDFIKPRFDFTDPGIEGKLKAEIKKWGLRIHGLVIIDFPTRSLSIDQLSGYLDYLEAAERFVPNVLIVDYPDLMKIDVKDYRLGVGNMFEDLRGLGVKRNMAIVAPTQGTRQTIGARRVRSKDAAEDIRKVNAADVVLAFSATEDESNRSLGRLSVEHARDAPKGAVMVLSQSYPIGSYVMQSELMQQSYWDEIKKLGGESE